MRLKERNKLVQWVNIALIVFIISGFVRGYIRGIKREVIFAVLLLISIVFSKQFATASTNYLTEAYRLEKQIISVLAERLSLTIAVGTQVATENTETEVVSMVEDMPLAPVFKDYLIELPQLWKSSVDSPPYENIIEVFAFLIITSVGFLFFFLCFLGISNIIASISKDFNNKTKNSFVGAIVGGIVNIIVVAVIATALAPFVPIFKSFIAWDIVISPLVNNLIQIGLAFKPFT